MVSSFSRQLLVWSVPSVAFLLTLLWYRRKRGASLQSDPGGTTLDTGSTSGDTVQQAEDLQVSITTSLSAEKHFADKEERCEAITVARGGIKIHTDKPKEPVVKEERNPETLHQQNSELLLEERVLSKTAPNVCSAVTDEVEDSDVNKIDTKKGIQEMSVTECPVDKLECSQKIPVKSAVKEETKIAMLESSVCNGLESPEHSADKISDTNSPAVQVEKEVDETANKKLSTSGVTNISSEELSEFCHLGPEVNVLATSEPIERTAEEQNNIEGVLEASQLNIVNSEGISRKLEVSDIRIEQEKGDSNVEFQDSEGEVQVLPLNVDISDDMKFVKSVEKDIDSIQIRSDIKIASTVEDEEEEAEDAESISSVDSFSVATAVTTHKSSSETLTMENHAHEEEGSKKSTTEMTAQESESVPLECTLSSLKLNGDTIGEASSYADGTSRNGAASGTCSVVSKQQRTERDSANHSPADVMLASPSISSCSDAQSEVLFHTCHLYLHSPTLWCHCACLRLQFHLTLLVSSFPRLCSAK